MNDVATRPESDIIALPLGEDHADIREAVRRICEKFPGALIPEEYGGSGLPLRAASVILEEVHASGCNAAACHAQMYIMGTVLRDGSPEQKRRYPPKIASGEFRLQA